MLYSLSNGIRELEKAYSIAIDERYYSNIIGNNKLSQMVDFVHNRKYVSYDLFCKFGEDLLFTNPNNSRDYIEDRIQHIKLNTRTYSVNITKGTCNCEAFANIGPFSCIHIKELISNREKYGLLPNDLSEYVIPSTKPDGHYFIVNGQKIEMGECKCDCGYEPNKGVCSHINEYITTYNFNTLKSNELISLINVILKKIY